MANYPLSINDLFRLAFSAPITWLSGEASDRLSINWVVFSIEETQPGDILLLDGGSFRELPAEQALETLSQAEKRGAAAVLLLGKATLPPAAAELVLPIAVFSQTDRRSVQRALLTVLVNQNVALMENGVRVHAHLAQIEAEGEGLAGLTQAMADISGRGIVVQDKRLVVIAEKAPARFEAQGAWEDFLKQLTSLDGLPEFLRDRKQAGAQTIPILQELPDGLVRLVTPISVGGMARGYLSIVGISGELDALDRMVAEQGALVCAIEMARAKAVRETEKRLKGDLLTALLQEDLSPRDAQLWAQGMDVDLSQAHVALRFAWDGEAPPSRRRLETLVNGESARMGIRGIVSSMGIELICISQILPETQRPETVLALGQAVIDQGAKEYATTLIRCGVGTPSSDLRDWRSSFRQAGQALEMARRFKEKKPLYFPDLSVYRLLMQIEHSPELIAFQEEILGQLLSNEGGRELIRTLEAYFEHNGNLSQTADALYIHRNTLIYRMERIAGITGLNLDKPETRLAIQLALHIHRMMGGIRT